MKCHNHPIRIVDIETMNLYTAQKIQNQERLGGWGPKFLERKCVRGEEKG